MKPYLEPLLLVLAIVAGSLVGMFTSLEASWADYFILAMLFFLFYNISWESFFKGIRNRKYIIIALLTNFLLIPLLAYFLAYVFVDASSAIFIGLIIYLVAPCTDWFLGFTKLAQGDVVINSALLPINLFLQILLLPVYLYAFTSNETSIAYEAFFEVFIYWVVLPFALAQFARFLVSKSRPQLLERSSSFAEVLVLISLILLVFSMFSANVESLMANTAVLPNVLFVILIFFLATFFIARLISRSSGFSKQEEVSLTMTTAARNAPLMLVVSFIFFPQEPVIQLVLVIGILVEFPHLITITYLLKRQA
ncbi:MAG TPA: hypothetical protein DCE41_08290 [Cytophagales bacterium]|nr:hypothetical protein [Cytophagales bacterium]HAA21423.1 hypothetical protein [Cytophagales bacterium]HAP58031.1 hypothetical protein [Cytophagales bacterium]